ncbi:MAG: hypothetical protein HOP29_15345 [Phycisphaerales bacterium]|nr:hypothetical protein [Phycisphaerales bacterium]
MCTCSRKVPVRLVAAALVVLFADAGRVCGGGQIDPMPGGIASAWPPVPSAAAPDGRAAAGMSEIRDALEERGVAFHLFVNDQYQAVVNDGADASGSGRNSASMDAFLTFDLDKLEIINDADVLLHVQSNWGAGINARTGSRLEVNDDADGDLGLHVAQLWYRQHFWERRIALTVGFLDYQTIVDRNAFANSEDKQFMSQALDNNPLVPLNIGLGASVAFRPAEWYALTVGVGDAQSVLYKPGFSTAFHDENRWFAYAEQTVHVTIPSKPGPCEGNYRVGVVFDPRPRANVTRNDRSLDGDDYGAYASMDQMVYRESSADGQGLGVFARLGYRTPETNAMGRFASAGFTYQGIVPGRNDDVLGFGMAMPRTSNDYRRRVRSSADKELIYELFYAVQVAKYLVVTMDVQYLDNPGTDGAIESGIVAGVRARFSF